MNLLSVLQGLASMRLRVALATLGIALLMPQTGSALPKGKPFEELNALIQENATAIDENGDLIEQNSTAILSLSSELTALDGRLGVLETDVDGLTTQFGTPRDRGFRQHL
jgi:hypothetical protein